MPGLPRPGRPIEFIRNGTTKPLFSAAVPGQRLIGELVGRGMAMTLSGKLAEALIKEHPPVVSGVQESAPREVIEELWQEFPGFVRACDAEALAPEEFREYGPFIRFQNAILDGLWILMKEIQSRSRRGT